VRQATDDNVVHAHCMLDTYNYKYTHSGYVILIAFPLQQWLHARDSVLRSAYVACLVFIGKTSLEINVKNKSDRKIILSDNNGCQETLNSVESIIT
jgi:hypothetical protein